MAVFVVGGGVFGEPASLLSTSGNKMADSR